MKKVKYYANEIAKLESNLDTIKQQDSRDKLGLTEDVPETKKEKKREKEEELVEVKTTSNTLSKAKQKEIVDELFKVCSYKKNA